MASLAEKKALMVVSQLASGVVYTEPMKTSWYILIMPQVRYARVGKTEVILLHSRLKK